MQGNCEKEGVEEERNEMVKTTMKKLTTLLLAAGAMLGAWAEVLV